MFAELPLFPEQASTTAARVDALYYFLVAISGFMTALIFLLILYFSIKYHRRSKANRAQAITGSVTLELFWTITPLAIFMGMFLWGARLYFADSRPPPGSEEIFVVGKQWMWKLQHTQGQREINELHVPVGKPIKLTMTSEDVIHSFYVPAFRVKRDVLPGRYSRLWFEATKPGTYHLFCAEYCGTKHSAMIGRIIAMKPPDYQHWLSGGGTEGSAADAGQKLFLQLGCNSCHQAVSGLGTATTTARGASLKALFGKPVRLQSGATVIADEDYIRESILDPNAKLVAGYQPIMPTFRGLVSEEGLMQLVAFIKSLSVEEGGETQQ